MGFLVIFFGFAILGLVVFIKQSVDEDKKVKKMTPGERQQYFKEQKESSEKSKYNNYMFTCPMCGSKKVIKITNADRAVSVATLGMASGKIGKQYECSNCKHRW